MRQASAASGSAAKTWPAKPDEQLLGVLSDEFEELHGAAVEAAGFDELYARIHGLDVPRAALCLSGGGIRSASFALGVLQALARHGLLGQFHYLSTVSGGGYIGGFLSAWRRALGNDAELFARLGRRGAGYPVSDTDDLYAETRELQGIRASSNFLTPHLGALSGDTLTVAALYLRNFLLNWLVFLPLFLAIIVVPHLCYDVLFWAQGASKGVQKLLWLAGLAFVFAALLAFAAGRPARDVAADGSVSPRRVRPGSAVWMVAPTFLAASCLALYEAHWRVPVTDVKPALYLQNALLSAGVYLAAWLVGFIVSSRNHRPGGFFGTKEDLVPPLQELVCWVLSGRSRVSSSRRDISSSACCASSEKTPTPGFP